MDFFLSVTLFLFATITNSRVAGRAVNISNTWMLPEEGFPVFYRYFRDRISWYEADAVCQFHHANLVTAPNVVSKDFISTLLADLELDPGFHLPPPYSTDSSSQYDAIRAYLKELDITESVWIGLSKTTEKATFSWTDFQPLSGEGHWREPIPKGNESLCVVMDPTSDFLWTPLTCGGPDVASFICELPVPSWAMGPQGCLLTELPSLTVLYIPEQLALELTSDCGLDGTKRIACKGNANREEILQHLTCAMPPDDFDEKSTKSPLPSNPPTSSESSSESNALSSKTTKPWIWTSNTIDIDYGMPTRHRRETEDTLSPLSTKSTTDLSANDNKFVSAVTQQQNLLEEVYVTSISPKIVEFKSTQIMDFTGGEDEVTKETQEDSSLGVEDTGEYPSAIGQGQLFSIIENGTMFDIIELNDTTSEDDKTTKDLAETPQSEKESIKTATPKYTQEPSWFSTTAVYPKEPPSGAEIVTNKSIKKEKLSKKPIEMKKSRVTIKENVSRTLEGLSKEVDLFPIAGDSMVKLNRTFRKEVPFASDDEDKSEFMLPNFSTNTLMDEHQHVEVKWNNGKNFSQNSLFITTKRGNSFKENVEDFDDTTEELHKIDSKINLLNNLNVTQNNDSEVFVPGKPEKMKNIPDVKEEFFLKSLISEENVVSTTDDEEDVSSTESTEPEPEAQPRPNRQRQLTRPQRRSFYPNFFSRVLG